MIVVLPVPELPIIRRLPYRSPWRCLNMATDTNLRVSCWPMTKACRKSLISTGFMGGDYSYRYKVRDRPLPVAFRIQ
jgi:hypothetical protein